MGKTWVGVFEGNKGGQGGRAGVLYGLLPEIFGMRVKCFKVMNYLSSSGMFWYALVIRNVLVCVGVSRKFISQGKSNKEILGVQIP